MRHILRSLKKRTIRIYGYGRFCELQIEMFRHLSAVFLRRQRPLVRLRSKVVSVIVNFWQAGRKSDGNCDKNPDQYQERPGNNEGDGQ